MLILLQVYEFATVLSGLAPHLPLSELDLLDLIVADEI